MASSTIIIKATCLVLVAAAVVAPPLTEAAAAATTKISCGEVTTTLTPCFGYVLRGGEVPVNCCVGVKSLYKEANTTADRRSVCLCLKSITGSASYAAIENAKSLPEKCGLSIPYEITPAIDCSKVN